MEFEWAVLGLELKSMPHSRSCKQTNCRWIWKPAVPPFGSSSLPRKWCACLSSLALHLSPTWNFKLPLKCVSHRTWIQFCALSFLCLSLLTRDLTVWIHTGTGCGILWPLFPGVSLVHFEDSNRTWHPLLFPSLSHLRARFRFSFIVVHLAWFIIFSKRHAPEQ